MRFFICLSALVLGVVTGALISPAPAEGSPSQLSRTRDTDTVCCGCSREDYSVDTVTNNSGSTLQVGVQGDGDSYSDFDYPAGQVQTISNGNNYTFTVCGNRISHCNTDISFGVDVFSGGTLCLDDSMPFLYSSINTCCP